MIDTKSILTQGDVGFYDFGKAAFATCDYFNPSLVTIKAEDWLIVRRAIWMPGQKMGQNSLFAFALNGKTPSHGHRIKCKGSPSEHFEDPRAIVHGERMLIGSTSFFIMGPKNSRWTGAHQILQEVNFDWQATKRYDPVYGKNGPSPFTNTGHEKNWTWFIHGGELHMEYQANPHIVCRLTSDAAVEQSYICPALKLPWNYGEIRGGTPPVMVDGEYWTFFHSSLQIPNHKKRQYHMGAYAFKPEPPFEITRITPEPILSGSPADGGWPDKPPCVFPGGSKIVDGIWTVVGGCNDIRCFYMDILHEEVLSLTVPVKKSILAQAKALLTA